MGQQTTQAKEVYWKKNNIKSFNAKMCDNSFSKGSIKMQQQDIVVAEFVY